MDPRLKQSFNLKEIEELDSKIRSCKLCRLSKTRTNAVPGFGKLKGVDIMLVGEAPGRNEDLEGKPFVGAGGKLLDELLSLAGLKREELFVTNIVKCRPPDNRKPLEDEIEICTTNYLERQIELLKPKLICTLGATALEYFTGRKRMGEFHGKLTRTRHGIALLPTYHPASVFRNPEYRRLLQEDLALLPEMLKSLEDPQSKMTSFIP